MRRVAITALVIGAGVLLYMAAQPSYTHRFRLTIEVETPSGVKTGSSVIETSAWEKGDWGPPESRGISRDFRGRAVFVDLGQGRNLIALLGFGRFAEQNKLFNLIGVALAPGRKVDWKEEYRLTGRGVLADADIPALATFMDVNDPASAVRVEPSTMHDIFGSGFAFRKATIETTNDAPSIGIEKVLPWWRLPGRPAYVAYRAWKNGSIVGPQVSPEELFEKR